MCIKNNNIYFHNLHGQIVIGEFKSDITAGKFLVDRGEGVNLERKEKFTISYIFKKLI